MWTWGATLWRIRRRCLNRLVPDTSFLVALPDRLDGLRPVAAEIERVLREAGVKYVYPDCVVSEVLAVVERRAQERKWRWRAGSLDLAGVEGLEVIGSAQEAEGWVRRRGDLWADRRG